MANKPMWMVRAGRGAYAASDFREKNVVGIGWGGIDWTQFKNRQAIFQKLEQQYPDLSPKQALAAASQIERFLRGLRLNDSILTYDPSTRTYLVGTIIGDSFFHSGEPADLPTRRQVKWTGEISRDSLSVSTRNSLGAISTLFRVSDDGSKEISALVTGKTVAAQTTVQDEIAEEEDVLKDIQARSHEFIKDRLSKLDWEEMQRLIAGLLRAMGYKTRVSPQGPDRGKDIIASPDGFGFESPRIVVEVKHRRGTMKSQDIRSFVGGRHKDDKGLYVSTGGFTKDAQYEAERSSIPLTLMDLDDIAGAIIDHYEAMDSEIRVLLPLMRIYWPT